MWFSAGICRRGVLIWRLIACAGSGAMFDASQYAFFRKDAMDEVELGGLEDDEEVVLRSIGGGFGGEEELNEYHLFQKDEVNRLNICCGTAFSMSLDVLPCCSSQWFCWAQLTLILEP